MKKNLLFVMLCFTAFHLKGQVTKCEDVKKNLLFSENRDTVAWMHGGLINVGINQGFLHNWAAGGELASLAVNGIFNGYLVHYNHNVVWSNNLDLTYGLNYVYSNNFVPRKIDDRIDFTSKYGSGVKGEKSLFYTALFNLKSQFTKGFDYSVPNWDSMPTSGTLSPAYLTLALGLEYRKGNVLSLFLSPLAARATYASAKYTSLGPQGAFGIPYGKTSKYDLGAYFSSRYNANLTKVISYSTRLDLYTNYLAKDTKDITGSVIKRDDPRNIQVMWDNLITWKACKWIGLTFGCTVAYNNDNPYSSTYIDKVTGLPVDKNQPGEGMGWVQFKEIFTLGLTYKF